MSTPFYRAAFQQPNLLLPLSGSGDERPPLIPPIICADGEPSGTVPIVRLILAGICPECGQPSLCPKCGLCHYCEDVDLPCLHAHHPLFPVLSHLGGGQCL